MFEVLETAQRVAGEGVLVRIDGQALAGFSRKLLADGTEVPAWDRRHHFYDGGPDTVFYLLVLDSLNFCFWPAAGNVKWEIGHKSGMLSGYNALAISLKQAMESRIPLTRPEYLAELSLGELRKVLGGRGELQLLLERVQILNEVGRVLLEHYGGGAHTLVEAAGHSAVRLVRLLSEQFKSFRDIADYRGHRVFFYKRAQIFAADLYGAFEGEAWGHFIDMDKMTSFADYKVPQVLRHLGIIHYEQALAHKVDRGILLEAGSQEEVEIRANTVWAIEMIRQELEQMGKGLRAFEIDWILWNMGQREEFKVRPYHKTVTVFY